MTPLFPLGQMVQTSGIRAALDPFSVAVYIRRHATGDWSEMDQHDQRANKRAISNAERILSAYTHSEPDGHSRRLFVITEWNRSVTTILWADEY